MEDYYAEIGLAKLPRDRWGALGLYPHQAEGSVWSAPITLPEGDSQVSLKADGVRGFRVEIADERFHLLPEYSGDHAGSSVSDGGLDCAVTWPQARLSALSGRTVRLRIHLRRGDHPEPRLYAVYVACE